MMLASTTSSWRKRDILITMKIGTIIIIVSVVWSIISGIIAKRQAAAKKLAAKEAFSAGGEESLEVWNAKPAEVRVESLRRRKRAPKQVEPVAQKRVSRRNQTQLISSLHDADCPLPQSKSSSKRSKTAAKQITRLLKNRRNLRTAIVLNEILSKPISVRN